MSRISHVYARGRAAFSRFCALLRRGVHWGIGEYKRHPASYLIFCFLLPFFLMLLIYAIMGTWPFGRGSVLVLDLNGQYVYFFEALRDFVYGDTSLLYSFSRSLGGEFMGMYAYYLASPLSYIVALFPKHGILDALFLMILIKQGLAGLSFGYFLRKTTHVSPVTTIIFSTVYAMSAYGVVMQHNTMWFDNVFLLPMVALGIRALVTEGRYKLYTFSLILCMMSSYYIGYMTCIFSVLYFFYVHLSLSNGEMNPTKQRFTFLRSGGRFAFFSLTAAAISALIIIPALYSLTFGKDEFSQPTYEFVSKLDVFDVLTKFFFGSYDTVRPEGLPFVYCGIITLLLIPFYFINRRIPTRKKAANLFLCLILVFSFCIQVVDMVWHGGQAPNWLNYRYSYMLVFLMVGMAAEGFEDARRESARWVLYASLPLLLILVLAEHFGYASMKSIFFPVGLNFICIAVYGIALSLYITRRDVAKRYAMLCMLVVVSFEMATAGLLNVIQLDIDVTISSRRSYLDFERRWEDAFDFVKETETTPFYRMEKTVYRKVNDPFMLDYRGISGSTSTLNADTIAFLNATGHSAFSHASCYMGTNPFMDSFLSISYVAGEAGTVFPSTYEKVYDNGDVVMYRNPDALPLAFGVSPDVHGITLISPQYKYDDEGNRITPEETREIHTEAEPFLRMNALASALLGEEVALFTPVEFSYHGENVSHLTNSRHYEKRVEGQDAFVNFTMQIDEGGEIFAYFPIEYPNNRSTPVEYYLNGSYIGEFFIREQSAYLALGEYEAGDSCTVSFKLGKHSIYLRQKTDYFFKMDRAVYDRVMATLSAGGYHVTECTEDYFAGTITVAEGHTTVLTTIPYDKGWQITVDGERIEGYETLDALLCFDLAPGEHTLTLRYMPKEYVWGFAIFGAGCLMLSSVILLEYYLKKHRIKAAAVPPERT